MNAPASDMFSVIEEVLRTRDRAGGQGDYTLRALTIDILELARANNLNMATGDVHQVALRLGYSYANGSMKQILSDLYREGLLEFAGKEARRSMGGYSRNIPVYRLRAENVVR